ncbi:Uncharacterised protein [Streptococcus pneumoniae]|nr:Uncharacterised protein [Streptococcus pneumoniae]
MLLKLQAKKQKSILSFYQQWSHFQQVAKKTVIFLRWPIIKLSAT